MRDEAKDRETARKLLDDPRFKEHVAQYVKNRELGIFAEPDEPDFLERRMAELQQKIRERDDHNHETPTQ